MKFYLGTHRPNWLWLDSVPPLCVPRQQLEDRVLANLKPAETDWFMDSGGFTELSKFGRWTITTERYVELAREFNARIGRLDWIAPQDWMCEPQVIEGGTFGRQTFAGTGKSVDEHIDLTVENSLLLPQLAPELPWRKVLQGYKVKDYIRCFELYLSAGVDLTKEPLVGVGSVCRRSHTPEIRDLFRVLHDELGLRNMHGFGVKTSGFALYAQYLASADSLGWSERARWIGRPLPECVGVKNARGQTHKNCANCLVFARRWYGERVAQLEALLAPTPAVELDRVAA